MIIARKESKNGMKSESKQPHTNPREHKGLREQTKRSNYTDKKRE